MTLSKTACALVIFAPLLGCDSPLEIEPTESSPALPLVDARPDDRPASGHKLRGPDLTELVRRQNTPGNEPGLPTDRGTLRRTKLRPKVTKTKNGFVAHIPGAGVVPSPAFYRGQVLTGGMGTHELHSLDPTSGKRNWSVKLSDDGPTAPACKDGDCVFNTYSCTIYSVAAATGKHQWSWWLGSPQLATPVIFNKVVYTSYPGPGPSPEGAPFVLAAFDLKTGAPIWRRWIDAEVNSTPVAYKGKIYVATQLGTLYEFSADAGKVLSVRRNRVASPPVVTADGLFFSRAPVVGENDMLAGAHPVLPSLEQSLSLTRVPVVPRPRPLVVDHRLVTVDGGLVVASDRKTGTPLWQRRFDEGVAEVSAPLLYAGGSVLLATAQGNILRLHQDTGDVMETFKLDSGTIASQPIVHDGWIYAGTTEGALVGYDTGNPELTGWHMLGGGPERLNAPEGEES